MSRTRLEKNPEILCGYAWSDPFGDSSLECPHLCNRLVADHGPVHSCCGGSGGIIPVAEDDLDL